MVRVVYLGAWRKVFTPSGEISKKLMFTIQRSTAERLSSLRPSPRRLWGWVFSFGGWKWKSEIWSVNKGLKEWLSELHFGREVNIFEVHVLNMNRVIRWYCTYAIQSPMDAFLPVHLKVTERLPPAPTHIQIQVTKQLAFVPIILILCACWLYRMRERRPRGQRQRRRGGGVTNQAGRQGGREIYGCGHTHYNSSRAHEASHLLTIPLALTVSPKT